MVKKEWEEIKRRMRKFRGEKSLPDLEERTTILVDDGLASGYSMLTTAQALESHKPKEVLVAIPTAPLSAIDRVKTSVDRIYCLNIRTGSIFAVASAYKNWRDLSDEEILSFLEKH